MRNRLSWEKRAKDGVVAMRISTAETQRKVLIISVVKEMIP